VSRPTDNTQNVWNVGAVKHDPNRENNPASELGTSKGIGGDLHR
jgi:hypothetical protein